MTGQSPTPTELLAVGLAAATAAGELLVSHRDAAVRAVRTKSGPFDLVTPADMAAEEIIRRELTRRRPDDLVLGEETGSCGSGPVRWLVDPLDGTTNYLSGLPAWAVSIAAEVDGEVVAAVVHAPALGRTYTGRRDAGAWCNGDRLTGPRASHLSDAVIATGFAASSAERARQLDQLSAWLPHVRDVRCHGAAALELCSVATGDLDAYVESGLQIWDVAAGALIVCESCAVVTGGPGTGVPLIAAATELSKSLASLIGVRLNIRGGNGRG